jgi:hypothetical protein
MKTKRTTPEAMTFMTMERIQAAHKIGVDQKLLLRRLKAGWSPMEASTKPVVKRRQSLKTKLRLERKKYENRHRTGWKQK